MNNSNNHSVPERDIPAELDIAGARRFQWLKNKEGRQSFGSRTVVVPLNDELYRRHVHPRLTDSYQRSCPTLHDFLARWPGETHAEFLSPEGRWVWRLTIVGPESRLVPRDFQGFFATEYTNFDDPEAIKWGSRADSEVYPRDMVPELWD